MKWRVLFVLIMVFLLAGSGVFAGEYPLAELPPEVPPEILPMEDGAYAVVTDSGAEELSDTPSEMLPLESGAYAVVVDPGAKELFVPVYTWSTGSKDSHGGSWLRDADGYYYPSIRILDEEGDPVWQYDITVEWEGDYIVNGMDSGGL